MAAKKAAAKPPDSEPDLGTVFEETAEQDSDNVKQGASAKRVRQAHLLTIEVELLLRAARRETATPEIIDAELDRVMVLTREIWEEADAARKALKL